jgi:hypothetical protein
LIIGITAAIFKHDDTAFEAVFIFSMEILALAIFSLSDKSAELPLSGHKDKGNLLTHILSH